MSDDAGRPDGDDDDAIPTESLVAYAEHRIPAGMPEREVIEARLAEDVAAAERVRAYRSQDAAIRRAWAGVSDEPIPARLQPARLAAEHGTRGHRWRVAAAAASILLAALTGFLIGRADFTAPPATVAESAQPPAEAVSALESVDDGAASVVTGTAAPSPAATGIPEDAELQQFHYSGPQGEPLYLLRSPERAGRMDGLRTLRGNGLNLVYWQQEGTAYALAGAVDLEYLQSLALDGIAHSISPPGEQTGQPGASDRIGPQIWPELDIQRIPTEPGGQPEARIGGPESGTISPIAGVDDSASQGF